MRKKNTSWENVNGQFLTVCGTKVNFKSNDFRDIMFDIIHVLSLLPPTTIFAYIALLNFTEMNGKEVKHCSLCFHNGEPEDFYR